LDTLKKKADLDHQLKELQAELEVKEGKLTSEKSHLSKVNKEYQALKENQESKLIEKKAKIELQRNERKAQVEQTLKAKEDTIAQKEASLKEQLEILSKTKLKLTHEQKAFDLEVQTRNLQVKRQEHLTTEKQRLLSKQKQFTDELKGKGEKLEKLRAEVDSLNFNQNVMKASILLMVALVFFGMR